MLCIEKIALYKRGGDKKPDLKNSILVLNVVDESD